MKFSNRRGVPSPDDREYEPSLIRTDNFAYGKVTYPAVDPTTADPETY